MWGKVWEREKRSEKDGGEVLRRHVDVVVAVDVAVDVVVDVGMLHVLHHVAVTLATMVAAPVTTTTTTKSGKRSGYGRTAVTLCLSCIPSLRPSLAVPDLN